MSDPSTPPTGDEPEPGEFPPEPGEPGDVPEPGEEELPEELVEDERRAVLSRLVSQYEAQHLVDQRRYVAWACLGLWLAGGGLLAAHFYRGVRGPIPFRDLALSPWVYLSLPVCIAAILLIRRINRAYRDRYPEDAASERYRAQLEGITGLIIGLPVLAVTWAGEVDPTLRLMFWGAGALVSLVGAFLVLAGITAEDMIFSF